MKKELDLAQLATKMPSLKEKGIVAKVLNANDKEERELFQGLRYKYWVEKFKFFKKKSPNEEKLEFDIYDEHAVHFGAFNLNNQLVGYSRFILPGCHGLQVRNEFEELVHPKVNTMLNISQSVESSRLIVDYEFQVKRYDVAQMIYKLKYQFMKLFGFKYWYIVAEKKLIRALKFQMYPFEIIGRGRDYYGSVRYPAVMDIDKVDEILIVKKPAYYKWLNEEIQNLKVMDNLIANTEDLVHPKQEGLSVFKIHN